MISSKSLLRNLSRAARFGAIGRPRSSRRKPWPQLGERHVFTPIASKYSMLRFALTIVLALPAAAQIVPGLAIPPSGNNQRASVTQGIGPASIRIEYSSPAVHGPDGKDRRGQSWGKPGPYGR